MGVRRGAWEQIQRGGVWKPGALQGGIPALSNASVLKARGRAAEAEGRARAAGAAMLGGLIEGAAKLSAKLIGIQRMQELEADKAKEALASYKAFSNANPTQYNPQRHADLENNAKATERIASSWSTKVGRNVVVEGITRAEAIAETAYGEFATGELKDSVKELSKARRAE